MNELKKSNVRHEVLDVLKTDSPGETDRFIEAHVAKNAYEKKLTQSEDVTEWIDDPAQISLIQPNLARLDRYLRSASKDWKLLDVGCYAGYVYDYLLKVKKYSPEKFSYTGIDIRDEAIEGASKCHTNAVNADFKVMDLFELEHKIPEGYYNFCLSSRVLVHLPAFSEAVKNILHCASDGAFIFVPMAKRGRCEIRKKCFSDTGVEVPYIYRYFSEAMIAEVAKANRVKYVIHDRANAYATVCLKVKRSPRMFFWRSR